MNKERTMEKEFCKTFEQPAAEKPMMLDRIRTYKLHGFMKAELEEFRKSADIAEQVESLIGLISLSFGSLSEMGIPPERLFVVEDGEMRFPPKEELQNKLLEIINTVK